MEAIAKRTQNLLVAGAKAMMIQELKSKFRNGVAHFVFQKRNGEYREIFNHASPMITRRYLGLRAEELEEVYNVLEF